MEMMGLGGFPCVGRTPESGEGTESLIPTLLGSSCLPTRVRFPPAVPGAPGL